jgi:hypothetical protein
MKFRPMRHHTIVHIAHHESTPLTKLPPARKLSCFSAHLSFLGRRRRSIWQSKTSFEQYLAEEEEVE